MRHFATILLFLFSNQLFSQTGTITGVVQDKRTKERYFAQSVKLEVLGEMTEAEREELSFKFDSLTLTSFTFFTVKSNRTDVEGYFIFDSLNPGIYTVFIDNIWDEKLHQEIRYTLKVGGNDTINVVVEGEFKCSNDEYINDQHCPKCHKKNRVIPIVYGSYSSKLPVDRKKHFVSHERYLCDPNWYCRRDGFEF